MEEDGETSSPFWMQNSSARHRNGSSNVFLSSGFLIAVLPFIALLVMVFVIPPIVSFTSEIVKPNLVKKSWDNVNLVLVLFAILCGILGRRNGNGEVDENVVRNVIPRAPEEQLSQRRDHWFRYNNSGSQQLEYDQRTSSEDLRWSGSHLEDSNTRMIGRPMRNSSSYPDLRQESLWSSYPNDNWRFSSDDNDLYRFRSTSPPPPVHHRSHSVHDDYDGAQGSGIVKIITVDTFVASSTIPKPIQSAPFPPTPKPKPIHSAPVPPPPPPPQQLQKEIKPRVKRITKPRENVQAVEDEDVGLEKPMQESVVTQPPPPPPPPPPLAPHTSRLVENKSSSKSSDHRRRGSGGGAKDIATTLASFYNQRKRKKKQQQQKSKENYDDILQSLSNNTGGASTAPPPPPPLPPPPPPVSVFQQLFKKGNKNKRIHLSSPMTSPPPPPPLPPHASTSSKRKTTHIRQSSVPSPPPPPPAPAPVVLEKRKPLTPHRPPFPTKNTSFNEDGDESLNSGWQSPLIPMPPPPPPPPFKMPEFKYVVRGDFIRLRSTQSSRSTSPDLDSNDSPVTPSSPQLQSDHQGGEALAGTSAFCPSPDVNTKADTFIARFRAGLKLEKNNSIKLKRDMGSRPGSSLRPSTSKNPT